LLDPGGTADTLLEGGGDWVYDPNPSDPHGYERQEMYERQETRLGAGNLKHDPASGGGPQQGLKLAGRGHCVVAQEGARGEVGQDLLRHRAVGQQHHLLHHLVGLPHLRQHHVEKHAQFLL